MKCWYLKVLLLIPVLCMAQVAPTVSDQSRPAQYFIGGRDQVLMAVNVWGFVIKPGQYMVPYNTDLISLLSYAGGPREEAKIKNIRIIRIAEKESEQVFFVDIKEFLKTGNPELNVLLKPGDTILVSGTTFHLITQLFDFTWRVATLAQVYFLAQWYSHNK
jgi:polysaccharide export outer membrane protein